MRFNNQQNKHKHLGAMSHCNVDSIFVEELSKLNVVVSSSVWRVGNSSLLI